MTKEGLTKEVKFDQKTERRAIWPSREKKFKQRGQHS
jgi:hypothetical protein